jgi:hypothetical protein
MTMTCPRIERGHPVGWFGGVWYVRHVPLGSGTVSAEVGLAVA